MRTSIIYSFVFPACYSGQLNSRMLIKCWAIK